jgi:hypothetical protein
VLYILFGPWFNSSWHLPFYAPSWAALAQVHVP